MTYRDGFTSQYISLCLGLTLYGGYLISILRSIRAFRRQGRDKWGLHVVAAMLFVLVTLDISLLIARLGFTVLHCHMCGSTQDGSCDPIPWFNRVKTFIVAFSALLTEGVMIYRCWIVHSRRWITIAVPCLLWVHGLVMLIYVTASSQNSSAGNLEQDIVESAMRIGFWVLTIILNFMTTALIVRQVLIQKGKCTQIDEAYPKTWPTTPHSFVIRYIMESGLMGILASSFVLANDHGVGHLLQFDIHPSGSAQTRKGEARTSTLGRAAVNDDHLIGHVLMGLN
ncbi:hypothetical protein AGABI2DRAFT_145727 [Agaricus bisporus var. bisporus H97]|uniref:hypothetical protein n=1 Tax=Agaricus bisporus var. bisporus (strain H97 / ATCC MYA-4626 / FGSC 10389) TaxID=936046 RepID=UPI00029F512D|nr:hypothetical protein AGABI2DRAFT_145727 [Agaricus bisporus var. bisporus H97]EKV43430.1 hypothetical protein AGABI2DRAFT_145727 [Agaricus bisporus var. bisporus H97]